MPTSSATFIGAFVDPTTLPLRPTDQVLICVGRSNVGKSTFINALAKQAISRTSNTPGRTQTINLFRIGPNQILIDLPGYGYARHSREDREQLETRIHETLLAMGERGARVCLITDASVGLTELDEEMLAFLREEKGVRFAVIANKADKLNQSERSKQEKAYQAVLDETSPAFFCSAKTLLGFNCVNEWIALDR